MVTHTLGTHGPRFGGKQARIIVAILAALSVAGCERLGLPGSAPQPAPKPPEPTPPVAVVPPPPVPEAAPPPAAPPPPKVATTRSRHRPLTGTDELVGLTPGLVTTRLGQPNLKRFDKPDQLWQYRAGVCLLELRLHPDGNQTKVAEAVLRPEPGQTVSDQDCLAAVNDALHLTP